MKIASIRVLQKKIFTKDTCILLDNFPESCVLRQRCLGRRSWGCTRRGYRIRATKIPSNTLAAANILEHVESRACLASDYLIREIVWREIRSRFSHPRAGRGRKTTRMSREWRDRADALETCSETRQTKSPRRFFPSNRRYWTGICSIASVST